MEPLRIILENVPEDFVLQIEKPLHPKVAALGKNKVPFTREVYIDSSDFRTEDDPDYFRLAPGKSVGLFQAPYPITCTSFEVDPSTGKPTLLRARYEDPSLGGQAMEKAKLKKLAYIQWVCKHEASRSPVKISEVRVFHPLFNVENPAGEKDFLAHINKDSLEVHPSALIETGLWDVARLSLSSARKEAEERTAAAKAERIRLAEEGGDVIRPPPGTSPLTSSGEGAPSADEAGQLVGLECVRFQAMRVGYFAVDRETVRMGVDGKEVEKEGGEGELVLNRIVSLKAAAAAASASASTGGAGEKKGGERKAGEKKGGKK